MKLVGYANLGARVPGIVVPVWEDKKGNLFGVFCRQHGRGPTRSLVRVSSEGIERLPEGWLDATIALVDPLNVCMVVLGPGNVIAYSSVDEERILRGLLSDPSFAAHLPFSRLAFAKLSGDTQLIVIEWLNTALHLLVQEAEGQSGAASRLESWLSHERDWLTTHFGNKRAALDLLVDFPSTLQSLGNATWFRNQLSVSAQPAPLTLAQIEDRSPSPKVAAVLSLEPTTPDERTLAIMGRHLFAGTNYVFFHGPDATSEAIDALRDAAMAALAKEASRPRSPLSSLAPPHSGTITFYQLGGLWTGSPYVFYEESVNGVTTVSGFRGLENCPAIAKSYEKLPDGFAKEVLEALIAGAPTLLRSDAGQSGTDVIDLAALRMSRGR